MSGAAAADAILSVRGLVTTFEGKTVHDHLDFDVARGALVALFGGSGSGKSTLLRDVIGLERPAAGEILLAGEPQSELDPAGWRKLRRRVSYVFQNGALFDSLTVAENLEYPLSEFTAMKKDARRAAVAAMLGRVGLPDAAPLYPAELSGGMQKRVGLARALMLEPEPILYDEPTAGLDPANTRKIEALMLALKAEGKTGVLVTHDVPCALRVADAFAFLAEGRIVAMQSRAELERAPDPRITEYMRGDVE